MTNQGPPAGWHPDPGAPGQAVRWWDGSRWTEHTQPVAPAPPAAFPGTPPAAFPGTPSSGVGFAAGQVPPGGARPSAGMVPYPGAAPQPAPPFHPGPGVPMVPTFRPAKKSFAQGNAMAFAAIGVAALYLVLAAVTHIVFIGIVPVVLAIRALQQRETLAPLALVAAIVAVVVGFSVLAHH